MENINKFKIAVDFRFCQAGEEIKNNQCLECPPGKYNSKGNSTECMSCPDNAKCTGGNDLAVSAGYWRASAETK